MTGKIIEIGDLECLADMPEDQRSGLLILASREQLKNGRNLFGEMVEIVPAGELAKLRGIIARNAMQRLKGEAATEMYVTPEDIKDSLEVLYQHQGKP